MLKLMKITTKQGDSGKSRILTGESINKDELIFEVLGTIDELNAFLGLARSRYNNFCEQLKHIQNGLLNVSAYVACGGEKYEKEVAEFLNWIEEEIERLQDKLELKEFIIFGDDEASSRLDVCRVICRRCERRVVSFVNQKNLDNILIKVFNRLSDLLFIYAALEFINKS